MPVSQHPFLFSLYVLFRLFLFFFFGLIGFFRRLCRSGYLIDNALNQLLFRVYVKTQHADQRQCPQKLLPAAFRIGKGRLGMFLHRNDIFFDLGHLRMQRSGNLFVDIL